MSIELRWLRSFLAVAEEHHFSRAARRLNLAQPALTAHIQNLEEAVGASLFARSNRMSGLTPAGRALLPDARAIVERTDALGRTAKRAARGESGLLRLDVIPPAAVPWVADSLRRFAHELPEIELTVRHGDQHRLVTLVAEGELDLVLGRAPESGAGVGLKHRRLFIEEQGVLLREDDPLARGEFIRLKQLDGARLLVLRGNPHFGRNIAELAERHGVRLTSLPLAEDFLSLHWLVRAGQGFAPCSLLLRDGLPRGLTARPLRPAPPKLEIHAIWRGATPPATAARWLRMVGAGFA